MKLKHQLADGAVDESEVDKYRNESCEDMKTTLEIAQPAPAAKTGDECEVKMPQKKPPVASQTSLAEPLGSGKAGLLDVLQPHSCAAVPVSPAETQIAQEDTLGDSAVNVAPSRPHAANAAQLCSSQEDGGNHRKHPKGKESLLLAKASSSMLTSSIDTHETADPCS